MNISKDQIIQLLESQGKHDQAEQAAQQLPAQVDTDNHDHASLLSKFGLDPGKLGDNLGGLAWVPHNSVDLERWITGLTCGHAGSGRAGAFL